ncbi:MAG: flagellar modification protein B [Ignavibacteriales bacterium CG12_big_fil_rev_8_21_14_0_65_30_8]|nr:MAG: flagellar modification protein B [Ignavibacteriales bacterium CG12_big_fil_rev_8_21_14_0_65_30_8]
MYKGKKILATICARGGSKGVKNKNIRLLNGIPLIAYSLNVAKSSSLVDNYVVSTDSDEIISVVRNLGYKVGFKRPDELAGDNVSRIDAIQHAVRWMEKNNETKYDIIADLGVATPLKSVEDLDNSIRLCIDNDFENVFSVCPCIKNPYFNMVEVINDRVKLVKEYYEIKTRQKAPKVYEMNDGFNVWIPKALFSSNPQFNKTTSIYVMPRERSVDIDEEQDFSIAEAILKESGI